MTYLSFCKLGIQDNQEELPNGKDPKWVIENSITPGLEMAKWKDLSLSWGKNGSSRASMVLPGPSILWSPRPWLKTNAKGRLLLPDSVSPGFLGLGSRSGLLRNTAPSRETGTRQRQSASGSRRLEAQGFVHGEPEHCVPPGRGHTTMHPPTHFPSVK